MKLLTNWIAELLTTASSIKYGDRWAKIKSGTHWTVLDETERGVQIREELRERYKNMDTGEIEDVIRKDTRTEWYLLEDEERESDRPEYVAIALDEGSVWEDELVGGGAPMMWGCLMSNGGSMWKRVPVPDRERDEQ